MKSLTGVPLVSDEKQAVIEQPKTNVAEQTPPPSQQNKQPINGLAIGSLVAGIIGFGLAWVGYIGLLSGIAAVVLGIIGLRKAGLKGMSIAGIATGSIATLWATAVVIILVLGIANSALTPSPKYNDGLSQLTNEDNAVVAAKKDFAKGETARFGYYDVVVNSVQRNYLPEDEFQRAGEGKEFVLVNITAQNKSPRSHSFGKQELRLHNGSVSSTAPRPKAIVPAPSFEEIWLDDNSAVTGNLLFEIAKPTSNLTLRYSITVTETLNPDTINVDLVHRDLVFTLAL